MTDELANEVCSEHELFGLEYVALATLLNSIEGYIFLR